MVLQLEFEIVEEHAALGLWSSAGLKMFFHINLWVI